MATAPTAAMQQQMARARRDQLLHLIQSDKRLPSLGIAISEVVKITSSGEESVNQLAKFILSDVSLTKDVLNLANSVSYRKYQGTNVTTISKAIFILGFDVVKSSALSMLMLECFSDKYQGLYFELTRSLCSSIIARECINRSTHQDAEEASVSALFKNIAQVLIAALDPPLYETIMKPVREGNDTLHSSAIDQIGCSLPHFGGLVLQQWNIPDSIIQAAGVMPVSDIKKTRQRSEWVRQVAAFSSDAAELVMKHTQFGRNEAEINFGHEKYTKELMHKYGAALELDAKILAGWLSNAVNETGELIHKMGMRLTDPNGGTPSARTAPSVEEASLTLDGILMLPEAHNQTHAIYPSGKPHNARDLLLAGLMEMTQTISSGKFQLNNLVLQILEILQSSLGFQFVTAGLKDAKTDSYIARISLGQNWAKKQKNFQFPSKESVDLFHLALKNNADLMIGETTSTKIHQLRPTWHLANFPEVKSLMILPLIVNNKPIGMIYADRNCEAPEGVPPDETSLIKAMKGQLITAMSK